MLLASWHPGVFATLCHTLIKHIAHQASLMPNVWLASCAVVLFAVLGMMTLGGKWDPAADPEAPRLTYNSFGQALVAVFDALTGAVLPHVTGRTCWKDDSLCSMPVPPSELHLVVPQLSLGVA